MTIYSVFIFVLGLIIGSFLNCLIYRLETSEPGWFKKMLLGRSFCPDCRHPLAWYDLIPVLSFVFLRGKCRYCRKKISIQYPIVEFITGVLFVFILGHWNLNIGVGHWDLLNLAYLLFIACCLIVIFVFDLKHYLIPDEVIYSGVVAILAYKLFEILKFSNWKFIGDWSLAIGYFKPLFNSLTAAFIAALFFFFIYIITKGKGMGFGDVKFAFLMGLFLGFPSILVALFFAFLSGAVSGLFLMVFRGKTLKSELPFGPFLVSGVFFALFFGQRIVDYYLDFLFR